MRAWITDTSKVVHCQPNKHHPSHSPPCYKIPIGFTALPFQSIRRDPSVGLPEFPHPMDTTPSSPSLTTAALHGGLPPCTKEISVLRNHPTSSTRSNRCSDSQRIILDETPSFHLALRQALAAKLGVAQTYPRVPPTDAMSAVGAKDRGSNKTSTSSYGNRMIGHEWLPSPLHSHERPPPREGITPKAVFAPPKPLSHQPSPTPKRSVETRLDRPVKNEPTTAAINNAARSPYVN